MQMLYTIHSIGTRLRIYLLLIERGWYGQRVRFLLTIDDIIKNINFHQGDTRFNGHQNYSNKAR